MKDQKPEANNPERQPALSPASLLAAWEDARNAHLKKAFEGCDMNSRYTPLLQISLKESFDAGWTAAIKYLEAANVGGAAASEE